ncbi:hypothetical protein ACVL92_006922 [Bradyrhizobium liaoningense]
MDPARMFKESLTPRPELENSQGHKRRPRQIRFDVRSAGEGRHYLALKHSSA